MAWAKPLATTRACDGWAGWSALTSATRSSAHKLTISAISSGTARSSADRSSASCSLGDGAVMPKPVCNLCAPAGCKKQAPGVCAAAYPPG